MNNFDFSVEFLKGELERCSILGIKKMVLHPGSAVNCSREEAIINISDGLNLILDNDYDVAILLETMAGKGNEMGKSFEELKAIIDRVLIAGEKYADRQANKKKSSIVGNVLQAAFRDYKNNPNNYNPGQPNYQQLVNKRANEVWRSPEIQNWYKTYLKRSLEEGGK